MSTCQSNLEVNPKLCQRQYVAFVCLISAAKVRIIFVSTKHFVRKMTETVIKCIVEVVRL